MRSATDLPEPEIPVMRTTFNMALIVARFCRRDTRLIRPDIALHRHWPVTWAGSSSRSPARRGLLLHRCCPGMSTLSLFSRIAGRAALPAAAAMAPLAPGPPGLQLAQAARPAPRPGHAAARAARHAPQ